METYCQEGPTQSGGDSRGAARRGRGIEGAAEGASVLSSDEGRSKGENGESGESEHGGCGLLGADVYGRGV